MPAASKVRCSKGFRARDPSKDPQTKGKDREKQRDGMCGVPGFQSFVCCDTVAKEVVREGCAKADGSYIFFISVVVPVPCRSLICSLQP